MNERLLGVCILETNEQRYDEKDVKTVTTYLGKIVQGKLSVSVSLCIMHLFSSDFCP